MSYGLKTTLNKKQLEIIITENFKLENYKEALRSIIFDKMSIIDAERHHEVPENSGFKIVNKMKRLIDYAERIIEAN